MIAIFERLTQHYMLPNLGIDNVLADDKYGFRSIALGGHPLANSCITTTIMTFILLSNIRNEKKLLLWILGFISLLCFNSRFSLVIAASIFFIFIIKELTSSKTSLKWKVLYIIYVLIMTIAAVKLLSMGFGDRLTSLGLFDAGSAGVRIYIFSMFEGKSFSDFIWGIPYSEVEQLQYESHTENLIIENCWILFLFRFGFIFLSIMIVAYIPLFKKFLSSYNLFSKCMIIIPWIIIISSSNSLATGGLAITTLLLLIYTYSPKQNKL